MDEFSIKVKSMLGEIQSIKDDLKLQCSEGKFNYDLLENRLNFIKRELLHLLKYTILGSSSDLISNLSMMVAQSTNMDVVLNTILDGLQRLIPYDAAGIFLIGEDRQIIESQATRGYSINKLHKVRQKVDEGIIGRVISNAELMNVENVHNEPLYISARRNTRSEIAVPIISNEEVIGCINLESDQIGAFSSANLSLLKSLASHVAVTVERTRLHSELIKARQLERELQIARRIQVALLPKRAPLIKEYDIAGLNVPSREIGGDYYDFIELTDNDLGLVIADVSGKGVPAGLLMSGLRAALRTRVETTYKIQNIISDINKFIYESTSSEGFVTAFYGVLNFEKHQLSYVNAGHDYPIILNSDGSVQKLSVGGPLLGVLPDAHYNMGVAKLNPGALLVMFTDGIVEAGGTSGEELGLDRLEILIRQLHGESATVIAREIERKAVLWRPSHGELDDRTVIVVKRL